MLGNSQNFGQCSFLPTHISYLYSVHSHSNLPLKVLACCVLQLLQIPKNAMVGQKNSSMLLTFFESQTAKKARMPLNPTTKSWSSWLESTICYAVLSDFIKEEVGHGRSTASNSLLSLEEMYFSRELVMKIHAQLELVIN